MLCKKNIYDYDWSKIGDRIKKERKALGINQTDFLHALGVGRSVRQSLGQWEHGVKLPPLEIMIAMCNLFQCELGYLLCEYDCKTRVVTDVQKVTGLSESAISVLRNITCMGNDVTTTLNDLIGHEKFYRLIEVIHKHTVTYNKKIVKTENKLQEAIADVMHCSIEDVDAYVEASSKKLIETIIIQIVSDLGKNDKKGSRSKAKKATMKRKPLFRF